MCTNINASKIIQDIIAVRSTLSEPRDGSRTNIKRAVLPMASGKNPSPPGAPQDDIYGTFSVVSNPLLDTSFLKSGEEKQVSYRIIYYYCCHIL
jgi:hypothetical protein